MQWQKMRRARDEQVEKDTHRHMFDWSEVDRFEVNIEA